MTLRIVASAGLAAALFALLDRPGARAPAWARLILAGLFSWAALGWTAGARMFPDAFPPELAVTAIARLTMAAVVLGAAAFAATRGREGLLDGAAFGLRASAVGWCASRWPQLARAIELCGGVFVGLAVGVLLTAVLAATHAALAAASLRASRRAAAALLAAWALATFGVEAALSRGWGFGPRSLAEAAGVPTNAAAQTMAVAWLYPSGARPYRVETRRMSSETTDLSPESLARIEDFLRRSRYRGVFAAEALEAVRLGRLQWWDAEAALEALSLSVPGRAHPDYLRALELLRAGPVDHRRYAALEALSEATGRRVEGFEKASEAQRIFEGFSAAYARFGDEPNARKWLLRLDGLWAVSEKKIEAGPLEDLSEGRVEGSVWLEGRDAAGLQAGLFLVWRSSVTKTTHYWLSGSKTLGADGGFDFKGLGPGRYVLALLGRPELLRGRIENAPGVFEVTYERPEVFLDPVRVRRGRSFLVDIPSASSYPETRMPARTETPRRLGR